ncbi:MAG: acyl transferase [Crocinitomicaceae bacterium]|nr:acyl transferase [Crocinitomicaceae bacterium]
MNVQQVQKLPFDLHRIFSIQTESEFEEMAIRAFQFQADGCEVYRSYIDLLGVNPKEVAKVSDIPFLPISFFKTHEVKSYNGAAELIFTSSGTTGQKRSQHHVADPALYQLSFLKGFERFYGHIEDYVVLALLPSYMENDQSSLIYMVDHLIELSRDKDSGFFLNDYERLIEIVQTRSDKKIILIGVSFALMDLAEKYSPDLSSCIVMETGGMKGRRQEITRSSLHENLKSAFHVENIHSEYGMTELLSQAYAVSDGIFQSPPWMKVFLRNTTDPFQFIDKGSGGINVIDLANIYSCSFIETEDLGRYNNTGFEVLGRFDNSDIRGCNLLIQ